MATICFPTVRGRVARFTRLNSCGYPVGGSCSTIVTEDIVSIKASAEVEEGDEISVKNMAGKLCISDKACDSIKWFTLELVFCKTIPPLYSLTSGYETTPDAKGNMVGYDVSGDVLCGGGFALEVWGDVPGVACINGQSQAGSGQYSYLVFPWVSAATLSGDLEIQNDAFQPTLSGTTKTGHGWGKGPYLVQDNNADPASTQVVPGPLVTAIPATKHFRHTLVTVAPPEPACECGTLGSAPTLTVAESNPAGANRRQVAVTISMPAGSETELSAPLTVTWGSSSLADTVVDAGTALPTTVTAPAEYPADGDYTITATYASGGGVNPAPVTAHVPFT